MHTIKRITLKKGWIGVVCVSIAPAIAASQQTGGRAPETTPSRPAQAAQESRSPLERTVTLRLRNVSIETALETIRSQAKFRLVFREEIVPLKNVIDSVSGTMTVAQALSIVLANTGVVPESMPDNGITLVKKSTHPQQGGPARKTIRGRIVDSASQKSIEGATVSLIGTKLVTVTNAQGVFMLSDAPLGKHQLQVRLIGYRTVIVPISLTDAAAGTVMVSLVPTATALSQVVTTATGAQRRLEVPSDIVRIDPAKIMERAPVQNFTDLLEAAQVPGVLVTRGNGNPGSPSRIRIRGLKSITQSNDPVVIVDGNWIDASVGTPSGFDDIDPATIESVEIIRGPSASTLYGQDAANGVIVITTKKGRAGPARWTTSYQRNWGQTYGTMPLAYRGYGRSLNFGDRRACSIVDVLGGNCVQDSVAVYDPNNPLVSREGVATTHRVIAGVEGGTSATTYAITATANRTVGVRRIAPVDQIRLRLLNIPVEARFQKPAEEDVNTLTTGLTLFPSSAMTISLTTTGSQTRITDNNFISRYPQLALQVDEDYNLDTLSTVATASNHEAVESPTRRSSILFGGRMDWRVLNGGVISANAGISRNVVEQSSFTRNIKCNSNLQPCSDTLGTRSEAENGGSELTARINVSKPLDLGSFSRVLDLLPAFGADFRKTESSVFSVSSINIPSGERGLQSGSITQVNQARNTTAVAGWYINMRVGVFRRMYFDVGARQDLGSAIQSLSRGNTTYPKLGGSWLVSDEPFWPKNSWLETFRLRGALGYAAIQPDLIDVHGGYSSTSTFINGKFVPSMRLTAAGNPVLKPERAMEVELGFDADLLGDRINLIATYAQSENLNSMVNRTLPPSVGGIRTTRKENIGRVRNRNAELSLTVRAIDSRALRMEFTQTMTMRDNIVMRLGKGVTPFNSQSAGRIAQGFPLASVWVRHLLGYEDRNGDGLLSTNEIIQGDSLIYAGWTQPRIEAGYGINTTVLGYLTFDARFSYRSKYVQQYKRDNKYGREDVHAPLDVQADEISLSINNSRSISDLRWNSASVTYHVPPSALSRLKMRSLSISLKGSNLNLWTNYVGRDPGVNSNILNSEIASENGNEIPQPRLFVLDFSLGL